MSVSFLFFDLSVNHHCSVSTNMISYHYHYDYYAVIETTHSGIVYGMQSSHKYFGHNWCRILQQPNCVHKTGLIKNKMLILLVEVMTFALVI